MKVGSSAMWNVCYIADLPPRGIICYIAKLPGGGEDLLWGRFAPYHPDCQIHKSVATSTTPRRLTSIKSMSKNIIIHNNHQTSFKSKQKYTIFDLLKLIFRLRTSHTLQIFFTMTSK